MGIGRDEEFEESFIELFVQAERAAMRIVRSRTESEDIAAETLVKALGSWRRVQTYRVAWVTRVATNLAIDAVRQRGLTPEELMPAAATFDATDRIALVCALGALPKRQRQALVLHYAVGLDTADAARLMGVSAGTLKVHLRRGLAAMRSQLGNSVRGGERWQLTVLPRPTREGAPSAVWRRFAGWLPGSVGAPPPPWQWLGLSPWQLPCPWR